MKDLNLIILSHNLYILMDNMKKYKKQKKILKEKNY